MLVLLGLDPRDVVVLPSPGVKRDRTYSSALGVRAWLESNRPDVRAVNLCSLGPHARRSRLLFEKALGRRLEVGVISLPPENFDAKRWWTSSQGFKTVVGEAIAYLYARVLFRP